MTAINARQSVVTDYGPNPVNPSGGLFRDIITRLHGFLVPAVVGADGSASTTFGGYAASPQQFKGAANPASTAVTYNEGNAEISSAIVEGPMGDPARRIFADRLRRRSAR